MVKMSFANRKRFLITGLVIIAAFLFLRNLIADQLYLRGSGFMNFCFYDDAIREYNKALFFNPRFDEAYNWLGYCYWQIREREKALATYNKAIEINPENRTAFFDKGMIYIRERDFTLALPCFQQAAALEPRSEDDEDAFIHAWNWVSICQRELGQIEAARETCRKILEIEPGCRLAKQRLEKMRDL